MGLVNVNFHGVCTHFVGVVPGVPHRVVLPDASALIFGFIHLPDAGDGSYFIMPHFPILRLIRGDVQDRISIPHVTHRGNIMDSVRLLIPNAVGPKPDPRLEQQGLPSIRSFVDHYTYSAEVVHGGRAAAYFDLFHAARESVNEYERSLQVSATIETAGRPLLRAEPFFDGPAHDFPLLADDQPDDEPVTLWVANQGMDCDSPENNFDYLLHYLTSSTGIPRRFRRAPPGLEGERPLRPFSYEALDQAAEFLKTLDYPLRLDTPCFQLQEKEPVGKYLITSVGCSNTTYP